MPFLIDCFSPSEMLHMVSLANRHQLLTTDQKRFLIGLRMAEIGLDGSYKVHPDKIGKFNRIFGQFLNELKPGERCDKSECLTCDRLQGLLEDFHGTQQTAEFQRFMDWFQKSTLLYNPADGDQPEGAAPAVAEAVPAAAPVSDPPLAESPVAIPTINPPLAAPLFIIDHGHPLILQLSVLLERDTAMFDDDGLRSYTNRLQAASRQLVDALAKA